MSTSIDAFTKITLWPVLQTRTRNSQRFKQITAEQHCWSSSWNPIALWQNLATSFSSVLSPSLVDGITFPLPLSSSMLETFQLAPCQENCPTPKPWSLIPARAHGFCQAFHRPPQLPPALTEVTEASSIPWPASPKDANPQISHLSSLKPCKRGLHLWICRLNHRNKSGRISLALPALSPPRSPEWHLFSRWWRKESLQFTPLQPQNSSGLKCPNSISSAYAARAISNAETKIRERRFIL